MAIPDLPTFLLARVAEREASAFDIHTAGCFSSDWSHDRLVYNASECNCGEPARVLACSAAMRAIVAEHATQNVPVLEVRGEVVMSGPECRTCVDWNKLGMDGPPPVTAPCRTLRAIAQIWADHPEFNASWNADRLTP